MQKTEPAVKPAEMDQNDEMKAKSRKIGVKSVEIKAASEGIEVTPEAMETENEEIRVRFEETDEDDALLKARAEEIKVKIAAKVREESQERSALTPEDDIAELDDYLRYGRIDIRALLAEMVSEDPYLDIKAITTSTGLFYVYSDTYIASDYAAVKSLVEEAKAIIARAIRADSNEKAQLTPLGDIYAMAPDTDREIIDVLLKGMQTETRYADIKTVIAANGDRYYRSDTYLVESYAVTLLMAMAGDHCATIAETVREESRIYPRTTNVTIFRDQEVYGIPAKELDTIVDNTLRKPEYSDIKKIVHHSTKAVYLYSDQYITEGSAWAMMDWDEVGRANNP